MRVLINAASAHMGGSVTYLQNVLRWLPEIAPDSTFLVYVPEATRHKLANHRRMTVRSYPYASTRGLTRLYFDQIEIHRVVCREHIDVLFSATGFGTLWSPVPQVLLVRNIAYFDLQFQNMYRTLGRSLAVNSLRRWHSLLSIRSADVVVFPSEAMKSAVERYISIEHAGVRVLQYGFDAERFRRNGEQASEAVQWVQRFRDNGHTLLLNVSTYAVHKNFETLIEALPALCKRIPNVVLLTTTSRERTSDKEEYDALKRRAEALGVADRWVELGYVPYQELHALYDTADVYVFPSFTESFGHTMVEAMALGLPVVAAGTDVNREVCGPAGAYFDTFDAADCANAIYQVLTNADIRRQMTDVCLERSQYFSWRRHSEELIETFRDAIQRRERG